MSEMMEQEKLKRKEAAESEQPLAAVEQIEQGNEAEQIAAQAEQLADALEGEQAAELARIDNAVAGAEEYSLSKKEVDAVKEELGLKGKLEAIMQKAKDLRSSIQEKVVDYKVKRFLKKSSGRDSDGKAVVFFWRSDLRDGIRNLRSDQLRRHPEIIEQAKANIARKLREKLCESVSDCTKDFQDLLEVFNSQPDVLLEILHDPEILALSQEVLKRIIYSPWDYYSAKQFAEIMHIDNSRDIVTKEIEAKIGRLGKLGEKRDYVYHTGKMVEDFALETEVVDALVLKHVIAQVTGNKGWSINQRDLREDYNMGKDEFSHFIDKHETVLKEAAYNGALNLYNHPSLKDALDRWVMHFEKELNLQLSLEELKQKPGFQVFIQKAIIRSLAQGLSEENREFLNEYSDVPLDEIIHSPEGQKAIREGIISFANSGLVLGENKKHLEQLYGRPVDEVLASEEGLAALEKGFALNFGWRDTAALEKQIVVLKPEMADRLLSIKLGFISRILKEGKYDGGFRLLKTLNPNSASLEIVAASLFRQGNLGDYLRRLMDMGIDLLPYKIATTLIKEPEQFVTKNEKKLAAYSAIIQKIAQSPSQEILRIQNELMEQILSTDDPEKSYEVINNIFVQNNLPLVGKVQRVFGALFPAADMERKLIAQSSPVLKQATERRRQQILFHDLLKVHIASGNRSLKSFLTLLQEGEPLIGKLNNKTLSAEDEKKLAYIFRKLKTVGDVSLRGQHHEFGPVKGESLEDDYMELRRQLGAKEGQAISERAVEMFARPLGYASIVQILTEMEQGRNAADTRSRENANSLSLQKGDLIKGVNMDYITNILQNGSVAKEFLGASSSSDSTPFDTDVEKINTQTGSDMKQDVASLKHALSFGQLLFVIKNRGQFQHTSANEKASYDPSKYELFHTLLEDHFGIRTGFPCTEVDFMILRDGALEKKEDLFYSLAENGYYIPIVDEAGNLILSPEQYDEYRAVFDGIVRFGSKDMEFVPSDTEAFYPEVKSMLAEKERDSERLAALRKEVRQLIFLVLEKHGVVLKGEYDDSILGAELSDTGSTGRGTAIDAGGDFDFSLRMDFKDWSKRTMIAQEIAAALGSKMKEQPIFPSESNSNQFRFFGSDAFSQKGIDIDIAFVNKSEVEVYASHQAVIDKLENIKTKQGESAYEAVIGNILLAKKWLKEGNAYKKGGHGDGGLGGIGVENLVLAYGGNVQSAFKAVAASAYRPNGERKSFQEFKESFKIRDAGVNLRSGKHDNFVNNMHEQGYLNMLKVIEQHQ